MKASVPLAALLGARLALACGAWAQEASPPGPRVQPRLEIGGTIGAIWHTPTAGILASLPAWRRASVEGGVNVTSREVIAQGQVRLPYRTGPGARRSVVFGLTHLSQRGPTPGVHGTSLSAHAGISAQAPLSRRFDLRADVQMIVPFRDGPDASPRAVVAFLWHR